MKDSLLQHPRLHTDWHGLHHWESNDLKGVRFIGLRVRARYQDGALCDSRGQLGPDEFEIVMRQQVRSCVDDLSNY